MRYKSTFTIMVVATLLVSIVPVYSSGNQNNTGIEEEDPTSINNLTKSYAEQINLFCKNDMHCPVMALDNLDETMSRQTVLGTFSDLVALYDKTGYDCHHKAHHLGVWLYGYATNLKEALSYATLLCGGAILHGIFQNYFMTEHDVRNVDKDQIKITDLCPISQDNIKWLHERDCIHGIGHGLVILYNYNTTAAVDRCNQFAPQWAQSACSRGIFMENNIRFIETGESNFDKNDIYFPCNRTVEKFAPQCYYYHPMYLLERNDYNYTETFSQCDNISPSEFAKYCYQGVGRKLSSLVYTNTEQAIAGCYLGSQSKYHNDCWIGTLRSALKADAKPDIGFKFCNLSSPDFKAGCYEIVGMWIKMFYPNKQEWERECAKASDIDYVNNCINATPEALTSITAFEPI